MSANSFLPESGHQTILERLRIKRDRESQRANIEANQQNLKDQIAAQAKNLEPSLQAEQERQIEQIGATARLQDDAQLQQQQMLERELFGQEVLQEKQREGAAEQAELDRQFQQQSQQAQFQQADKQQDKSISAQADAQEAENKQRMLEMEEEGRLRKAELDARLLTEKELQTERITAEQDMREEERRREDELHAAELELREKELQSAQEALQNERQFNYEIDAERRKQAAQELRLRKLEINKQKISSMPDEAKNAALTKIGTVVDRTNEAYNTYRELGGAAAIILSDDKIGDDVIDSVMKAQDRTVLGIRGGTNLQFEDAEVNAKLLGGIGREVGRRLSNQIMPTLEEIAESPEELEKIETAFNEIINAAYKSAPGTTKFMDESLVGDNLKGLKAHIKEFMSLTGAAGAGMLQEIAKAADIKMRTALEALPADTSLSEALLDKSLSRNERETLLVLGGLTNITRFVDTYEPMSKEDYTELFGAALSEGTVDKEEIYLKLMDAGWKDEEIRQLDKDFRKHAHYTNQLTMYDERILEAQESIQESLLSIGELQDDRDFESSAILGDNSSEAIRQYRQRFLGDE